MRIFSVVVLATTMAIAGGAVAAGTAGAMAGSSSKTKLASCADVQTLANSVQSTFADLTGSSSSFKAVSKQLKDAVSSIPAGSFAISGTTATSHVNLQASIKKLAKLFDQLAGGGLMSRASTIKKQKKTFAQGVAYLEDYASNNCPGLKVA